MIELVGEVVMRAEMTAFLSAAQARGCRVQVGSDMLFALFHTTAPGLQLLRGALMVTSGTVAYMSLRIVPVGDFTAILMLVPLAITVLAAPLLRERVPALTWWPVAGGFAGALIVIRPEGSDFQGAMLLPLALVLINALTRSSPARW
ncbi:MAG: hypothetical protein Q8L16_12550 [Hydrogenophaga sp.]|nr:hypothetical protein [Hydrogenophaga sp.]